ncbi:Uncharacterised protein [Vibrio cholerae]|nr:Uncharacterised protein [Vibrio cholerae]
MLAKNTLPLLKKAMLRRGRFDGFNTSNGFGQKRRGISVGLVFRFHFFADQRSCNQPQHKINHKRANH